MKKSILVLLSVFLLASIALVGCSSSEESTESSVLDQIKDRGVLNAGINGELPGFSYLDDGDYVGFDVDFAKAVAAAILGDANAVEYSPLTASERFTALQTGAIDLLSRNTTWTTSRDVDLGLNFGGVTFYDGQGMMVRADSDVNTLTDMNGMIIAVETGTTTELNLADQMAKLGVSYQPQTFDNQEAAIAALEAGSVDAFTTDKSGLVSRLSTMADSDQYKILDDTMSKEPLGPVVAGGDDKMADLTRWVLNALIQAEELGITSENVDSFLSSDDPVIQRLLGTDGNLGEQLEVSSDFAYQAIKQVGNYGEIFERHLGEGTVFNLDRGLNDLYTNGGLLYSPPFR
ncbi:amino acid ABC transporter substrate-binding protein [Chengkuizengella axinellae]|uniref:Amino acid ABC transporter substrate-binding protein n=1 Tax=Chengkuizengella axinellae TaxID=3064388 RepID=A0ABT9J4J3_9BACL|nr:amino acid ABC transporter substrate-binding protein [Chengkuizengella sp. 2205SS18-9]MDP5276483.1 amino acid ABC transporter substrate-binding protein [Chengkuizengella sp. 2205SS18-9]